MNYFESTTEQQLLAIYRQWDTAANIMEKLVHVGNAISVLQAMRGYYLGTLGREDGND